MEIEKQEPKEENFNVNQDWKVKFKFKDRLKILFGYTTNVLVVTTVKEKPKVLNSTLTIKI